MRAALCGGPFRRDGLPRGGCLLLERALEPFERASFLLGDASRSAERLGHGVALGGQRLRRLLGRGRTVFGGRAPGRLIRTRGTN